MTRDLTEDLKEKLLATMEEASRLRKEIDALKSESSKITASDKAEANLKRRQLAVWMRKSGSTYSEIGRRLGVTGNRARSIVVNEEMKINRAKFDGLSVRAQQAIMKVFGYSLPLSLEQLEFAQTKIDILLGRHGFGRKCIRNLNDAVIEARRLKLEESK